MALFPLAPVHRRYVTVETVIGCVINGVISAVFAWAFFPAGDVIELWGDTGMALDLVPTVFMLTLMTAIVCTIMTRKRVRNGGVAPLPQPRREYPVVGLLPANVVLRGLAMAIVGAILLIPLSVASLDSLGVTAMPFVPFLIFKVVYGAALSALISPIIFLAALSDAKPVAPLRATA